jgi:hypothetical protein
MITFFNTFVVANHNNYCILIFRQYLGTHIKYETPQQKCHDYYMTLCEIGRETLVTTYEIVGEITL